MRVISLALRASRVATRGGSGFGSCSFPASQAQEIQRIDKATLECAERMMGIDFSDAEQQAALSGVNTSLANFERLRQLQIPLDTEPALTFRPYLPGRKPRPGATPNGKIKIAATAPTPRRNSVEDLAFLPVTTLSAHVRKREVSSTELTQMYLARLKKHGPALNCVVTLTEELALAQAAQADKEIKAGRYRGPLHGIPWGAKDLFATKGILTTWGAAPFQNQVFDAIQRIREPFSVQTPADRPYGVLFAFSTASSGVRKVSTDSTGPKISSCAMR